MNNSLKMRPLALGIALCSSTALNFAAASDTLPYQFVVSPYSEYSADDIYIAVVGYQDGGYAFMDFDNDFEINQMDSSDNTLAGPNDDGYTYIDMFKPLSEIEDQTIPMPELSSVRMYIGFGSPLYIRYDTLSDSGGYVAPTINNEGDANYGIRFEMVELTYNEYGLWTNTTRVDSYQYPMGIEVWGDNGFYKRVGEILTHDEIVTQWQTMTNEEYQFQNLYLVDGDYDIILNPSHHEDFSSSDGQYEDYFDDYVDAVWSRYSNENLCLSIGEAGKWVGQVNSDNEFVFTEYTDDYIDENTGCNTVSVTTDAMISDKPSTYEILSASGVLAEDVSETSDTDNDKNIQKHFSAGFNRGVIDLDADYDEWVSWDDEDEFFNNAYYGDNNYVEFWHDDSISFEGETYAFAYDDVFDYSSTIHTTDPEEVQVTVGGFAGDEYIAATSIELSCDTLSLTPDSSATLTAEVDPSDASNNSVVWSTSNSSVVTVDEGEITAVAEGSATITASSYTEDVSASCVITVAEEADENFIERIEAEDYSDMYGIQTETTSDTGGGENVGWIDPDDWMEYSLDIPASGTYQLDFRLASPYDAGSFDIMSGSDVLASVSVDNTGSYQSWATQSTEVYLSEGEQTLTLYVTGDGWNINWFEIYSTDDSSSSTDDSASENTIDNSSDTDDTTEETADDSTTTDDSASATDESVTDDSTDDDTSTDEETDATSSFGTLYLIEEDSVKSLSLTNGSSETGATITGDSSDSAISFAYQDITASYNDEAMSYNICFDTLTTTIGTGPKLTVSYDFDGDGEVDRVETAGYFALDPVADSWECWTNEDQAYTATGDDYQNFENGSVTVAIWNAIGDAGTTEVKVNAATDASAFTLPYESETNEEEDEETVNFSDQGLYPVEYDSVKSLSLTSGSSETSATITGDSSDSAIDFSYQGITASYNDDAMSYNICFDTLTTTVGTGPQFTLSYDFDGDGEFDRVETAGYFALDPVADSWECWTNEDKAYTATGDDYQDFENGSVTLSIWNALGDASTTEVKVNADSDATVIYIPYGESSGTDDSTDDGSTDDDSTDDSSSDDGTTDDDSTDDDSTDDGTTDDGSTDDGSTDDGTTDDDSTDDSTDTNGEWELIWQDEFDTDEIDTSKWDLEENCWGGGNNEQQCYTDQESNAYIDDGILYITAINESYTGASANEDDASYDPSNTTTLPYTSARLRTKNLADFKYGRFEISAKLPSGQGTWPAIWMLPTDYVYGSWAASGEIDIMEAVNLGTESDASDAEDGELERRVYGTLHYGEVWPDNVYSGANYELPDGSSPADDFHEYAIEWEEGAIRWYVDDVHYATQTSDGWYTQYEDENGDTVNGDGAAPFDEYFHIIMNLAVGGDWAANVNETGIDSSAFPAQMAVDYVRVYQCSADPDTGLGCATESDDAELVEGYEAPEIITLDDDFLSTPLTMIYEDSLDDNLYFQSYNPDGYISYSEVSVDDHGTVLQIDQTGTTGNVYLATGTEADFSDWEENGAVVFDMRVLSKADDTEFLIKMDSEWPYVSDYSVDLPSDTEWVEMTIMISDILANDNSYSEGNYADISSIVNLLVFEPTDEISIQLDNIRLEEQ